MKTIKIAFSIVAILALTSCGNSTENTTTTEPPAESAAPAETRKHAEPAPAPKENPDHTEIGVDENGVSYSKKKGDNETDVKIKTDSNSVRIRKRN